MSPHEGVNQRRAGIHAGWLTLVCLILISGCTAQFLYNRLNFLIPWYLGGHVTLDEAQEAELKSGIATLTAWHRSSQLTRYSAFMRSMADQVAQPVSREEIVDASRTVEGFWVDIIQELTPDAAHWLQSLTPAQVDELLAGFAEDDEDSRDEECTAPSDKQLERRKKGITRAVKYWSGSINDSQQALIDAAARDLRPTGCDWLESRARWRDELRRALAAPGDPQARDAAVRTLLRDPRPTWTQAYRSGFEANRSRIIDLMAALDTTWTSEQRKAIQAKLRKLAGQLDELAKS
ncbi:MAG TPA: DUF6279 family lipoprotein [Steroidobacteraceae bacterium]|nr:DUF6279 family lipoprotein [Steroidobacteraceae bacterium]